MAGFWDLQTTSFEIPWFLGTTGKPHWNFRPLKQGENPTTPWVKLGVLDPTWQGLPTACRAGRGTIPRLRSASGDDVEWWLGGREVVVAMWHGVFWMSRDGSSDQWWSDQSGSYNLLINGIKCDFLGDYNPLILTFDPNFQRDIQVGNAQIDCKSLVHPPFQSKGIPKIGLNDWCLQSDPRV